MLSEPQRDLDAQMGEKDPVCQTLWFAPRMAQLQVPITQLWGPHLPPSNPRSSFLNLPKPMCDWAGAQTSVQGGGAETLAGLGPHRLHELSRHSRSLL